MSDYFPSGVATPGGSSFVPPKIDFSSIGNLRDEYYKGQEQQSQQAQRVAFRNGIPKTDQGYPDFDAMADTLAKAGAPASTFVPLAGAGIGLSAMRGGLNAINGGQPGNGQGNGQTTSSGQPGTYDSVAIDAESGGNPSAKNPNSSAGGPAQFTDGTWKDLAQRHPELELTPGGQYDPAQVKRALPVFTAENSQKLDAAGVPVTARNQYLAHFLGADGAVAFYAGMRRAPTAPAYTLVSPDAARANQTVFFNPDGSPKTALQVYGQLTSRFAKVAPASYDGQPVPTQVAGPPMVRSSGGGAAAPQAAPPAAAPAATSAPAAAPAPTQYPTASKLVPPQFANDPGAYVRTLETAATALGASAYTKGMAQPLLDHAKAVSDAIKQDMEQPPAVKEFNVGRQPGETLPAYQARVAGMTEDTKQDTTAANKELGAFRNAGYEAADAQDKVQWLKSAMSQPGVYTGPLNKQVKLFNQWKTVLGGSPSSAMPQEAFDKVVNDLLTSQIRALGKSGVGRVLLAEVQNMKNSIASGEITPASNRALLELVNRTQQQSKDIADLLSNTPHTTAAQQAAVTRYYQQHPLISDQEKKNPLLLGAPDAPANIKTPAAARAWAATLGLKPGDAIRFNGKYAAVP